MFSVSINYRERYNIFQYGNLFLFIILLNFAYVLWDFTISCVQILFFIVKNWLLFFVMVPMGPKNEPSIRYLLPRYLQAHTDLKLYLLGKLNIKQPYGIFFSLSLLVTFVFYTSSEQNIYIFFNPASEPLLTTAFSPIYNYYNYLYTWIYYIYSLCSSTFLYLFFLPSF